MHTAAPRSAIHLLAIAALLLTLPARAVIVRGKVTTPLGLPLGNARIQLIQGGRVVAFTFSLMDGTYELRSGLPGRFVLLTSASPFTPSIGDAFYGGRIAVVSRNIVLEYATVTPQLATTSTAIPTPIQQVPAAITLIPRQVLETQINLLNDLRQAPGTNVLQTGQTGGPIELYVRGGSPDANKILIDGIPATNLGGPFDFSPLATTALTGPEIYRGANSALEGTGAEASIVSLGTTRSNFLRPTLDYTGDAGNLHTYRNEAILSGTYKRLDYQAAFNRLNTSNALPRDQFHLITSTANIGYTILTNTTARFTLRNADSAAGLPQAHDIYGISASGKQSDQDLYSGITIENILAGNWHNLARYGISRKREQEQQFDQSPDAITYGDLVTLRGANGYTATGQAAFLSPTLDNVHNRDQLDYQTDYTFPYRIAALFSFHYEDERGRLYNPTTGFNQQAQRTNFLYTLQLQGDLHHRLFYSFGGAIERNHLYGTAGTPRLGLTYVPVLPGHRPFHGTSIRANIATGVQEPTLEDQFTSLDTLLAQTANQSAIATYNIRPLAAQRSRTFDLAVDQNILNQKLILKAGYFHNQFSHQLERLAPNDLEQYFSIPANIALQVPDASLNSLAYRTQGLELELQYQPLTHLFLRGGYTYLASLVEQSFTSDNVAPAFNPDIPGVPIGALSPIVGNRPFNRPPSTGFFAVQYSASRFSAAIKGALASRSDDSTFQLHNDRNGGNTLLLPNQDVDFGYAKLDLNLLFSATRHVTVFTQLDNLLSQQHIGPIGYPGLPFTIRAGLKIRIGGN
ncbi:TonB-dependent receptor plug domain-containing protein [Tunturibacter empetritectus]|uniref:TonB-dependent receptor plug domain-containing protein n=1 Tax=Tunturiibacter empetritectus TaxID=3069691 RepID=A0AAU7ZCU1_9BACT